MVTIGTAGLLSAVPFFHAASRLERPHLRKVGAGMATGGLVGYVLFAMAPTDADGTATGWVADAAGLILLAVTVIASVMLIGIRRDVYNPSIVPPPSGNQGALAGLAEVRRRRAEARELAATDPVTAMELGIGRPGVRRAYDDGGLLDPNAATPDQLSSMCGVPRDLAADVVAAREALGRFLHVEDAIVYGKIGEEHAAMVRERGIVIAVA